MAFPAAENARMDGAPPDRLHPGRTRRLKLLGGAALLIVAGLLIAAQPIAAQPSSVARTLTAASLRTGGVVTAPGNEKGREEELKHVVTPPPWWRRFHLRDGDHKLYLKESGGDGTSALTTTQPQEAATLYLCQTREVEENGIIIPTYNLCADAPRGANRTDVLSFSSGIPWIAVEHYDVPYFQWCNEIQAANQSWWTAVPVEFRIQKQMPGRILDEIQSSNDVRPELGRRFIEPFGRNFALRIVNRPILVEGVAVSGEIYADSEELRAKYVMYLALRDEGVLMRRLQASSGPGAAEQMHLVEKYSLKALWDKRSSLNSLWDGLIKYGSAAVLVAMWLRKTFRRN